MKRKVICGIIFAVILVVALFINNKLKLPTPIGVMNLEKSIL